MLRKRQALPFTASVNGGNEDFYDPQLLLNDLHEGNFSKHRSCWRHLAAHKQGEKGKMTEGEMKEIKYKFGPCFSHSRVCRQRSNKRSKTLALPRYKMSSTIFDKHMENIWNNLSDDKKASFSCIDSFCFHLYQKKGPQGLKLINRTDIFSKKYVFVPIVCWDHWRLAIFCHFALDTYSSNVTRCILLLDSIESSSQLIGACVRKFVYDIFQAKGRAESKDAIYKIPLLVPKVPQQTNGADCGRFVLYFIKKFIEGAPRNFSISNRYPNFMGRDWFPRESFEKFCDDLEAEIPTHTQETRPSKRVSQRITRNTSSKSPRQIQEFIVLDE